jgi:hypothetical protein
VTGYAPHEPRADDPYWKRWIARHGAETWARLPVLRDAAILRDFAELACTTQHMANINIGRWGALAMPRDFVLAELPAMLATIVAGGDEWELRRALELGALIDRAALVPPLVALGAACADPGSREAAAEFAEDPG